MPGKNSFIGYKYNSGSGIGGGIGGGGIGGGFGGGIGSDPYSN